MSTVPEVKTVTVVGAGNMGSGIAQVATMGGYDVVLRDVESDLVEAGYERIEQSLQRLDEKDRLDESPATVLDRLKTAVDLESEVATSDLVIEAVPEQLDLKREVFSTIDDATDQGTILATNTSSLSVTDIATATDRPEQVLGLHFFNPPVRMDLVEVIYGEQTTGETAKTGYEFVESIAKTPIYVRKDVRGFVVNTVLFPYLLEPAWMVSNDEATIRQADAALVHECGYPMGPFELTDFTGIDINYHALTEAGKEVPPILAKRYEAEAYGRKVGRGYYDYDDGDGVDYEPADSDGFDTLRVEAMMVNAAAGLIGDDVAPPAAIDTGVIHGGNFPHGICERGDEIGLDVILEELESLFDQTGDSRYEPNAHLVELVEAGKTGGADGGLR